MLSFFRRVSNSKIGRLLMGVVVLAIMAGFAIGDLSNFGSGDLTFGLSSSTVAEVGSQEITEQEVSNAMQRHLEQVRQQQPTADYASVMGDFDELINELINNKTLLAFANKFHFPLSKRLVDAEIAQIPQTKGLNGQFSEQAYQQFLSQQRLTDREVREVLAGGLLQRYMLTPIAANARLSVGMATPYASMLLESREGEAIAVPVELFRAGLKPTDADLQAYYTANRNRYIVPEQRVIRIAKIGPEQVANVVASDQEIASYYNTHKTDYAAKDTRNISQAIVQDQATANAIAERAKAGATIAAAAAPAGASVPVTSLKDQTQDAYASVAGKSAAAAVFAASSGAVVGPIRGDFGWTVAKVDSIKAIPGKTLDQARAEISAKLTTEKRKAAIEDLVDRVQDAVDGGSNFTEATTQAKLAVTTTPLVTATGTSRADSSFKLPADLAPALKTAFELEANDPPEIVTLPNDEGYALVSPGEIVHAAPAPLATVKEQVANDWINGKALERARAVSNQILAKAQRGMPLAQALKESGAPLPPVQPLSARRIQIASAQGRVPVPLKLLFSLAQGKSMIATDTQGRGFFIVKVTKIVPGNALTQPALIAQVQQQLEPGLSDDYARQFLGAMQQQLGTKRNEKAIQAVKEQLARSGG